MYTNIGISCYNRAIYALSPDGTKCLSQGKNDTLEVWDRLSGKTLSILSLGDSNLHFSNPCPGTHVFSPKGKYLLSQTDDASSIIHDVTTGAIHRKLKDCYIYTQSVAISPDDRRLVGINANNELELWDLTSNTLWAKISAPNVGWICDMSINNDTFITLNDDGKALIWSWSQKEVVFELSDKYRSCRFSIDGKLIFAGVADTHYELHGLNVYSVSEKEHIASLARGFMCEYMVPSPDGKHILIANSRDNLQIKLLAIDSNKYVGSITGDNILVGPGVVTVTSDSSEILLVDWDNQLHIWRDECASSSMHQLKSKLCNNIVCCKISQCCKYIVATSYDGKVYLFDKKMNMIWWRKAAVKIPIWGCDISPDSKTVVITQGHNNLKLLDVETGCELGELDSKGSCLTLCQFSPNGEYVMAAAESNDIQVWDLKTKALVNSSPKHSGWITDYTIAPNNTVVSAAIGVSLQAWSLDNDGVLTTDTTNNVYSCAIHPKRDIAAITVDYLCTSDLKVWDLKEDKILTIINTEPLGSLRKCRWIPDTDLLICENSQLELLVLNPFTGEIFGKCTPYGVDLKFWEVSSNGKFLVTAGDAYEKDQYPQGYIKLFEIITKEKI